MNKYWNELFDQIIKGALELEDGETGTAACIQQYCQAHGIDEAVGDAAYQAWFKQEAVDHGVPRAVVESREPLVPKPKPCEPDIDICSACGEHAGFERTDDGDCVSECCGAGPICTDVDWDMER